MLFWLFFATFRLLAYLTLWWLARGDWHEFGTFMLVLLVIRAEGDDAIELMKSRRVGAN